MMCQGHEECKTEEEIRKWLKRKYILLLYNQIRFETEGYFDEAAKKESRVLYFPINTQVN